MASPGRCLIGTYSEDSGEIMRKISILAVAAASFALSPLAMAQETDAPAPPAEPAPTAEPAPEPTAEPAQAPTEEPAPAPGDEERPEDRRVGKTCVRTCGLWWS